MQKTWPILYGEASTGKTKQWQISVFDDADGAIIVCKHGYCDGQMQENHKVITSGKNIGKSNETTPYEQACSDAQSKWQKKKDELYYELGEKPEASAGSNIVLPMLAHKYKDRGHDIEFPCFVQPKLNGVRCIYQHGKFISRKGKEYGAINHMANDLKAISSKVPMPDGEIFHRGLTFQEITSAVKKYKENSEKLEYWIYDQVSGDDFSERNRKLHRAFQDNCAYMMADGLLHRGCLVYVPTEVVNNEDELMSKHAEFTLAGYEGTIIRNMQGKYLTGLTRSKDLQKYKDFQDAEFKIVGGKSATGVEDGCVVFRCEIEPGKEFDVRPQGTREQRREWFDNLDRIIGKDLTVRFQNYSDDGVPIFPVGITIRDYE